MEPFPECASQRNPSDGNPSPSTSFENTDAPFMATLSLPRLTIGLPVWLFSTSIFSSVQTTFQLSSTPPEQHKLHVDPKVDPSPYSPISSPRSSSSLGESLDSSNQEAKNKEKRTKKKKKNNQRDNQAAIATDETNVENSSN